MRIFRLRSTAGALAEVTATLCFRSCCFRSSCTLCMLSMITASTPNCRCSSTFSLMLLASPASDHRRQGQCLQTQRKVYRPQVKRTKPCSFTKGINVLSCRSGVELHTIPVVCRLRCVHREEREEREVTPKNFSDFANRVACSMESMRTSS